MANRIAKFQLYISKWTNICLVSPIKNMSMLDLAVDVEIIIPDIKELNHFKDKNKLVPNES